MGKQASLSNSMSRTRAAEVTSTALLPPPTEPAQLTWIRQMTPSFFPGRLAYFCLFALHPASLLPLAAAVPQRARPCLTRRRVLFFFFLWRRRSQAESIRLGSKRKGKEKEPTGASWGKDCISSHEPQDGRTGQDASETDSLPLVHAGAAMTHHSFIYT